MLHESASIKNETVEERKERNLFPLDGSFYELLVCPFGSLVCPRHKDLKLNTNLDEILGEKFS